MKQSIKIFLLSIISLITISISAQQSEGNSVKGQINLNAFAQSPTQFLKHGDFYRTSYNIDASYGISKHFDLGIYYSYNHISQEKYQELIGYNDYSYINNFGILSRYFLTSYFIKRPVKFDFYMKGFLGRNLLKRYSEVYDTTTYSNQGDFGLLLGTKYMPLKRFGIMAEFGYGYLSDFIINLGLSFRIK